LFLLVLAVANVNFPNKTLFLSLSLGLITLGTVIFANDLYLGKHAGIKNDGVWFKSLTGRGFWAWILGITLTLFYIVLYWYPQYLGLNPDGANTGIV
ncbi:FeS-binding protein, partial [Salegentibacter sp. JZCK2]|nr:FeS-binding protein [Salegentibacter tibetensis]